MEKLFTTAQAAKQLGISRQSLQTWISAGIVQPPPKRGGNVRLWTSGDIAKAAKVARSRKTAKGLSK
jgi:DNA-binding transcriptional MerR regulator